MHPKGHRLMHDGQMLERQPPHLSLAKFPQQPSTEHIVLLEAVDVLELLEPTLPLDAELRLELDPVGLGDFAVLLGITIEPLPFASGCSVGGGGTMGKIGALPVSWSGMYSVASESAFDPLGVGGECRKGLP